MSSTEPSAAPQPATVAGPRRRLVALTAGLALLVLALDQLTKWWAQSNLESGAPQTPVVGDLLSLRLVYNPGAALSMATGMTWLLTIIVVVVVVVIVRMMGKIRSRAWAVALGLLLGGAVGNLADRLFRPPGFARGHVVDFIGYADFFTGNVADIAIVLAAVLIAILAIRGIGLDGTRSTGATATAADTSASGTADTADDTSSGISPQVGAADGAVGAESTDDGSGAVAGEVHEDKAGQ